MLKENRCAIMISVGSSGSLVALNMEEDIHDLLLEMSPAQKRYLTHFGLHRSLKAAKKFSGAKHSTVFEWRRAPEFQRLLVLIEGSEPQRMASLYFEMALAPVVEQIMEVAVKPWAEVKGAMIKVKQWAMETVLAQAGMNKGPIGVKTVTFNSLIQNIKAESNGESRRPEVTTDGSDLLDRHENKSTSLVRVESSPEIH